MHVTMRSGSDSRLRCRPSHHGLPKHRLAADSKPNMEHLDSPIDPRLNFGSEPIYPHPPNAAPRLAGPLPPPQYHRSPHDAIPPPPQLYMPQTPQSAGNLTDDGGAGALDSGDYAKRPRGTTSTSSPPCITSVLSAQESKQLVLRVCGQWT